MTENLDFEDFQQKVLHEFDVLKTSKSMDESYEKINKQNYNKNLAGCILTPLIKFGEAMGRKYMKDESERKNYREFEIEAESLLAEHKIHETLCESIKSTGKSRLLTEENFIKTIVEALSKQELRKQFVIPLEPVLFAFIAFKVSNSGIENFCDEV